MLIGDAGIVALVTSNLHPWGCRLEAAMRDPLRDDHKPRGGPKLYDGLLELRKQSFQLSSKNSRASAFLFLQRMLLHQWGLMGIPTMWPSGWKAKLVSMAGILTTADRETYVSRMD